MRACWYELFGPARDVLVFVEMPSPDVGPSEVLVKIATSGVNPSDVKKRAGADQSLLEAGPIIPHSDGAGVIEEVGADVSLERRGERVWIYQAQYGRRFGTAAERIAIDASRAVPLPDNASFEVGACLGIPAMTAHRCVFADGPVHDQTLLVTGGAGRVGHYAIQFAKHAGGNVVATASNPADSRACVDAGADVVVNHRESNWAHAVLDATNGRRVDRVIDVEFGANLPEVLKLIRTSGTIATYSSTQVPEPRLPFGQMMFMDIVVRLVIVYAMPESAKQQAITDINDSLRARRLKHRVARTLPFDEIARAHELVEEGNVRGGVVVVVTTD